jgi:hypothetical protein
MHHRRPRAHRAGYDTLFDKAGEARRVLPASHPAVEIIECRRRQMNAVTPLHGLKTRPEHPALERGQC